MTVFKSFTDEQVMEHLSRNFSFIVGDSRPMVKPNSKNDASITKEEWFHQMSFLYMFSFCQAFHEATARGLMNAFEQKAAQELFDML